MIEETRQAGVTAVERLPAGFTVPLTVEIKAGQDVGRVQRNQAVCLRMGRRTQCCHGQQSYLRPVLRVLVVSLPQPQYGSPQAILPICGGGKPRGLPISALKRCFGIRYCHALTDHFYRLMLLFSSLKDGQGTLADQCGPHVSRRWITRWHRRNLRQCSCGLLKNVTKPPILHIASPTVFRSWNSLS